MSSRQKQFAALLLSSMFMIPGSALASDMEHRIVSKVIDGYGGSKFENMKSISIETDLRYGWTGQGHTPHFVELVPMKKIHKFDLKNQRGSEEAWGAAGSYSERVFADKTGETRMDFIEGTYTEDKEAGFYDHFGSEIRSVDTLVAYELIKQRNTASYKGDKFYRGDLHNIIGFDMLGTEIDPVLWVNAETGHISLMQRDVPNYAMWSYSFDDFRKTKGITYAEDFVLFSDNNIIEYAKSRSIDVGRVKANVFTIDRGVSPEPETFDSSEMSIDKIAPNLYHAGEGSGYGAFVDAGEYLIALGGYGGLKARYEAYIAAHGVKPLRHLILTHHHSDHVASAKDALDLGASLVLPEDARANVNAAFGSTVPDEKLLILTDEKTTIGSVDVYIVSMPHVQNYALIHVPEAKVIFQEDLYNSNFKDRAARVSKNGLVLKSHVDKLGLDVEHLLGAHGRKSETWDAFLGQAKNPLVGTCPTGRRICR